MARDHHDHDNLSHLSDIKLRVRAIESILVEKGYVDPAAMDVLVETYETRIGPRNGAKAVAKAWTDPAFREWLLRDAAAALASLGYAGHQGEHIGFVGRQGEHMLAVENTLGEHNMVVCTLCSCYPWPVLGLPPVWYKSAPYRSRAVMEPRAVGRSSPAAVQRIAHPSSPRASLSASGSSPATCTRRDIPACRATPATRRE